MDLILDPPDTGIRFDGVIVGLPLWIPDQVIIEEQVKIASRTNSYYLIECGPVVTWSVKSGNYRENTKGALESFTKLADGNDADILAFVKKWGPLDVRSYLNRFKERGISPDDDQRVPPHFRCLGVKSKEGEELIEELNSGNLWEDEETRIERSEFLSDWYLTARQFRAYLLIAYDLQRNIVPSDLTWGEACGLKDPRKFNFLDILSPLNDRLRQVNGGHYEWTVTEDKEAEPLLKVAAMKVVLGLEISRLLCLVQAYPILAWADQFPLLTLSGSKVNSSLRTETAPWEGLCFSLKRTYHDPAWNLLDAVNASSESSSLFLVLVLQLVTAIKDGLYCCDYCHSLFSLDSNSLKRKPRLDRGAYCSDWCSTQKHREHDRNSYARRKAKKAHEV